MRQAIGEGRAVIENELVILAVLFRRALIHGALEQSFLVPKRQNSFLDLREIGVGVDFRIGGLGHAGDFTL